MHFWNEEDLDTPPHGDPDQLAVMEQEIKDVTWRMELEHTLYLLTPCGDRLDPALRRLTSWEVVDLLGAVQADERRGEVSRR